MQELVTELAVQVAQPDVEDPASIAQQRIDLILTAAVSITCVDNVCARDMQVDEIAPRPLLNGA